MLVFSQDRKRVMECTTLRVSRNIGAKKDEKYSITGSGVFNDSLDNCYTLALFPDEKTAMDELEKVYNAFAEGATSYKF
ncbi:MAG: hypothetical protein ACI4WS_06350 [Oscillospiraceae bacterium]